jgi:hypothetical protein
MKSASTFIDTFKLQVTSEFLRNASTVVSSLLVFGVYLANADTAFARDVCKNVKITITNTTPDTIKVKKFEYFDADKNKFRTENLLGVDGREILDSNKSFTTTRNLGQVGNDTTAFKVTYQHRIGGIKFESPVSVMTGNFKCTDGIDKTVSLDK